MGIIPSQRKHYMYQIKIDELKNRVYIILGAIEAGEGQKINDEVQKAVTKLKKGFTAVSDITQFSFSDPKEGEWADKTIQLFAEAGLATVARVTGNKTSTVERADPTYGYRIVMVSEFSEADPLLDSLRQ